MRLLESEPVIRGAVEKSKGEPASALPERPEAFCEPAPVKPQ